MHLSQILAEVSNNDEFLKFREVFLVDQIEKTSLAQLQQNPSDGPD